MSRPRKPLLLFCDQDHLASELRMVLEVRMAVRVHIESDLTSAVERCWYLFDTEERFQLIMAATGDARAADRLRDLGEQCGVNFLRLNSSEPRLALLDRVRFLLRQRRGPKPASKECAA